MVEEEVDEAEAVEVVVVEVAAADSEVVAVDEEEEVVDLSDHFLVVEEDHLISEDAFKRFSVFVPIFHRMKFTENLNFLPYNH